MQPGTSFPVGDQHVVVYSPMSNRDIWLLYELTPEDRKHVESYLFDSTEYASNREKRRAAVAAAEEHLRLPGPFDLDSCLDRMEFVWQQMAVAHDMAKEAIEQVDRTSFQMAVQAFQAAVDRRQELHQWMDQRGFASASLR